MGFRSTAICASFAMLFGCTMSQPMSEQQRDGWSGDRLAYHQLKLPV